MPEIEIPHNAEDKDQKKIGILIAVIAVITALVSAMGKDAANTIIVSEVKASNGYAWYQAKRQRSYLNDLEIGRLDIELLGNPTDAQRGAMEKLKAKLKAKNAEYEEENKKIMADAKHYDAEAAVARDKNEGFDHSEIFLQIAVVLCSLTLLTGTKLFQKIGIVVAAVGVVFGLMALLKAPKPEAESAPTPGTSTPAKASK